MTTKHYVHFKQDYGRAFTEQTIKLVDHRNPRLITEFPEHTFAFHFFDIEEETVNGEMLTGKQKNKSTNYLFGKTLTREDVIKIDGKDSMLYKNMEDNDWDRVFESCRGRVLPMNDADIILGERP